MTFNISTLVFPPYNDIQILEILQHRTKILSPAETIIFDKFGLEYCAKKNYALNQGDIRFALHILQKAYISKQTLQLQSQQIFISGDDILKVYKYISFSLIPKGLWGVLWKEQNFQYPDFLAFWS